MNDYIKNKNSTPNNYQNNDDSGDEDDTVQNFSQKTYNKISKKAKDKTFTESVCDFISKALKCNFRSLKQYFDVTAESVSSRMLNALVPFNPNFYNISKERPDLYGPFWIYSTLIFIIAATGEITDYLFGDASDSDYFAQYVPLSTLLIYGCGFGLPLVLWGVMKLFGSSPDLVEIICIYGYSFTSFIPIAFICMIPSTLVHLIAIGWGVFVSTTFVLVNYWKDMSQYIPCRKYFLIAVILAFQVVIYLELVFYFYGLTGLTVKEQIGVVKDTIINTIKNSTISNSTSNSTSIAASASS